MRFVEDSLLLTLDLQTAINQKVVTKYFLSIHLNILCVL